YQFVEVADHSKMDVFEEAQTYPLVSLFSKSKQENYDFRVLSYIDEKAPLERTFNSSLLGAGDELLLGFILSDKYDITHKVQSQSVAILSAGQINATSTASEAEDFRVAEQGCSG
ncbi:unnamed protein product, partial [Phaeothamnion confervicola]